MTVICPSSYHIIGDLRKNRVVCIPEDEAIKRDIRALRIGILNIMPRAQTYEFNLLHPLGRSVIQIEPIWIKLKGHRYRSSDQLHLQNLYVPFEEVKEKGLDGLIITGAPVEEIPFEEVEYWDEFLEIIEYAKKNVASTLGICWGGLAIGKFLGMEKTGFNKKRFGVFETWNLEPFHYITGEMDDVFWCPHSSHSGISNKVMEKAKDEGIVNLLAYNKECGYTIFESKDGTFLAHLGHPEYNSGKLAEEYFRDKELGRNDVEYPANFDVDHPINRWKSHRYEFFSQWLKFVLEKTPYKL